MRLATHSNFKEFVLGSGLEFFPLGGDPKVLAACEFLTIMFILQVLKLFQSELLILSSLISCFCGIGEINNTQLLLWFDGEEYLKQFTYLCFMQTW